MPNGDRANSVASSIRGYGYVGFGNESLLHSLLTVKHISDLVPQWQMRFIVTFGNSILRSCKLRLDLDCLGHRNLPAV